MHICTVCHTEFKPKPEYFGIVTTLILGCLTIVLWILTLVMWARRNRCTACGAWRTLNLETPAGQNYVKRLAAKTPA